MFLSKVTSKTHAWYARNKSLGMIAIIPLSKYANASSDPFTFIITEEVNRYFADEETFIFFKLSNVVDNKVIRFVIFENLDPDLQVLIKINGGDVVRGLSQFLNDPELHLLSKTK